MFYPDDNERLGSRTCFKDVFCAIFLVAFCLDNNAEGVSSVARCSTTSSVTGRRAFGLLVLIARLGQTHCGRRSAGGGDRLRYPNVALMWRKIAYDGGDKRAKVPKGVTEIPFVTVGYRPEQLVRTRLNFVRMDARVVFW